MKILVIGSGGREHAICWKLKQSKLVDTIYCAPGNDGIGQIAECVNIIPGSPEYIQRLIHFAQANKIDLTVVGSEAPLADGIVDHFHEANLKIFGPSKDAAILEASKVFAKRFMSRNSIPTAGFQVFKDAQSAIEYVMSVPLPVVVKADGLAAGKGVIICSRIEEAIAAINMIMVEHIFGEAGRQIIIEECLTGEEVSVLAFTDGEHAVQMVSAQDHKRIFDHDKGPNTGGMGAYAPYPGFTPQQPEGLPLYDLIQKDILEPTICGLREEGRKYVGVIYLGLMLTKNGPKVLEYNIRFGDPECQAILPLLETDLVEIMLACMENRLNDIHITWKHLSALCIVLASGGYPASYKKNLPITGLDEANAMKDVAIFHAGTSIADGQTVTSGGRVLNVVACGKDICEAKKLAYEAAALIRFDDMHYRKDIGDRAIK
ncbi:phosphoribosylamine--glycine ligase [bacterium]|nr:phosphoribosylamine--glycine ligase [bacterium]MBU1752380.1 phosphoribosylamine--glycine ligase [bacterium]